MGPVEVSEGVCGIGHIFSRSGLVIYIYIFFTTTEALIKVTEEVSGTDQVFLQERMGLVKVY